MLVVQHHDPRTDELYWVLPGGGREPGETFAEAAVREVYEETGVDVRLVRRLRVPGHVDYVSYALFLAEAREHIAPVPQLDLSGEVYLRATAWCQLTPDQPLGELNPSFWWYLAPLIRRVLRAR